ncbi:MULTISPECIES: phosphatase PAP2 family protein [unclassified Polaribacter]|jgi:membrane-associated phospholipid phosphatase|uniref:phosphatase PAP2 family protein n=1 Tax=unclassified Polaribacter TaxID=196858 RepID=UPI00052BDB63|nr:MULTISPECIES: phosphatase PAP2 family protein [unclassified Polaribacter]KGL59833.1 phosphoesterase, PA-phosphatase related protein [Polaribacter sp. Hel1_33_49]PKV65744.1 membrane-associated phospholipid phosphatase [Polaribacter sp. Hel1_33_96]
MKKILLLLFLLSCFGKTFSQIQKISLNLNTNKNLWQNFTYDLGNMAGGMGYAYSRPLYWKKKQFTHFGYIAAGTTSLYFIDDNVDRWADGWRGDVPRWLVNYGNDVGSPNNNFMLTGAVYLAGLFTENPKLRRTGVLLISSASAAGLMQQITKRIIGRARPKANVGKDVFDPLHFDRVYDYDSFPSGHVMLGFTNAYAIAKQFKSPWVKAGLYTIGSIPGLSRIIDRFHWFSDVAFSTALSIFIVEAVDRFLDNKYDQKYNPIKKEQKVVWDLKVTPQTFGVVMNF